MHPDQELVNAMVKANRDRKTLARLLREGKVRRHDGKFETNHPELAKPFVKSITDLTRPPVNLAIRPKKRKKR